MGLWSKIKKAFDAGGVKMRIDSPEAFRWEDPILSVAVELTNTTEEERVVTLLEFAISETRDASERRLADKKQASRRDPRTYTTYRHEVAIRLGPGETTTSTIDMPLSLTGALDVLGADGQAPGWMSKVGDAIGKVRDFTDDEMWYDLSVRQVVEGANVSATTSRRIRRLRPGEIQKGAWTINFG